MIIFYAYLDDNELESLVMSIESIRDGVDSDSVLILLKDQFRVILY